MFLLVICKKYENSQSANYGSSSPDVAFLLFVTGLFFAPETRESPSHFLAWARTRESDSLVRVNRTVAQWKVSLNPLPDSAVYVRRKILRVNPLTSRPGCMPGSRYTGVGVLFFYFSSFEAGIANAISSFKWRKIHKCSIYLTKICVILWLR